MIEPDFDWQYYNYLKADELSTDVVPSNNNVLFSVVIPVYKVDLSYLKEAIDSVKNQVHQHWEICISDDASNDPEITQYLKSIASEQIQVHFRDENGHICKNTNDAFKLCKGEFVVLLDQDDLLADSALAYYAKEVVQNPEIDLLYSDEDKIDDEGNRFSVHFKPDFSRELLLAKNYITHLMAIRRSVLERVGGLKEGLEGSQDHDLAMRVSEVSRVVKHVPHVLYHWRAHPGSTSMGHDIKSYTSTAQKKLMEHAMLREGVSADIELLPTPGHTRILFKEVQIKSVYLFIDNDKILAAQINETLKSLKKTIDYQQVYLFVPIGLAVEDVYDDVVMTYCKNVRDFFEYVNPLFVDGDVCCVLPKYIRLSEGFFKEMFGHAQRNGVGLVVPELRMGHKKWSATLVKENGVSTRSKNKLAVQNMGYAKNYAALKNYNYSTLKIVVSAKVKVIAKLSALISNQIEMVSVADLGGERIVDTPHAIIEVKESPKSIHTKGEEDSVDSVLGNSLTMGNSELEIRSL